MSSINYWWEIEHPENGSDNYVVIIRANTDIINVRDGFNNEEDAGYYAEIYIEGYEDALYNAGLGVKHAVSK